MYEKIVATQFLSCLHKVQNFSPLLFPHFLIFSGSSPFLFWHRLQLTLTLLPSSSFLRALFTHSSFLILFLLCFTTTVHVFASSPSLSVSLSPWFIYLSLFELPFLVHSFSLHKLSLLRAPRTLSCASFS